MEQITPAQLNSALMPTAAALQRRLSSADGLRLTMLLEAAQRRWPNQDMTESTDEYLTDFERLSLKYSLPNVEQALEALRIKPGQAFFPRPDEVAAQIEAGQEARHVAAERNGQARRRAAEIEEFWVWAPVWMADTGNSEEELLKRWPSMRRTKARAR